MKGFAEVLVPEKNAYKTSSERNKKVKYMSKGVECDHELVSRKTNKKELKSVSNIAAESLLPFQ